MRVSPFFFAIFIIEKCDKGVKWKKIRLRRKGFYCAEKEIYEYEKYFILLIRETLL